MNGKITKLGPTPRGLKMNAGVLLNAANHLVKTYSKQMYHHVTEADRLVDKLLFEEKGGYVYVLIGRYKIAIHRLLYLYAVNGKRMLPATLDIHHIDGNPLNNNLDNLQGMWHWEHVRLHQGLL